MRHRLTWLDIRDMYRFCAWAGPESEDREVAIALDDRGGGNGMVETEVSCALDMSLWHLAPD
jgi:hypothetical protein